MNSGGAGDASGTTYNGSVSRTLSYNTIGAPSTTGANASGTWGINITGNANTVGNVSAGRIVYGGASDRQGVNQITNWNQSTLPDAAFLSSESSTTNAPSTDFTYGVQTSFHRSGPDYRTQFVTSLYGNNVYWLRQLRDSAGWSSWVQVWHSGNFTPGNYLPLSGGTMTGKILGPSVGADVYGGLIEVRERGYVLATQSDWSFSPAITFHWGDRAAIRFGLRADGNMAIDDSIILRANNFNSYSPTLTGGGASGTWGINITGTAGSETLATVVSRGSSTGGNRPIVLDNGGGAIITTASAGGWAMGTYYKGSGGTTLAGFGAFGTNDALSYAWIGSAYNSAWLTIDSGTATFSTAATINGIWQTNISTTGGWSKLSFTASNNWGDGTTYGTLGASGGNEPGVMINNMHATWASTGNGAGIRMGRSGGVSSGAWYQVATMSGDEFMIAKTGDWGNGGIKILSNGAVNYGNTGYRFVHNNGTWDINVTGTSTRFASGQSNWAGTGIIDSVIGLMAWKNYGNNHVIFDASQGTSPSGGGVSQTNSTVAWSASYPTLMGWNGSTTYGVRVDSARVADSSGSASSVAWSGVSAGYRENYDLGFRPSDNSSSYAGFRFGSPGNDANAGYFLIRGGADSDVYTQNGITIVADLGWLTLAQRTTASRGVRIMTGSSTSTVRASFATDGSINFIGDPIASSSFRAPIFYDTADTGYYGDFASTSRMNNIILGSVYNPVYQGQLVLGHTSYNFNFLNGSWSSSVTAGILANCADEWEFVIHDSGTSVESVFIYQNSTGRILMGRDIGWGTTPIQAAADFRAPQFRFTNSGNSAYMTGDASWGARIQTDSGYILFGPANGSYAHIYTDRGQFYFNKDILINNVQVVVNSGTWSITATGNALVNGNTSNTFGVLQLQYAPTNFNPSAGPRNIDSMSIKMWNNYFNGTGLGSDYGTVMQYYSLSGHVDSQVYFDAGGGSWYRTASYASGYGAWQKYVTENSSPTFTEVYANNWFRNNESNEGLYNQVTTQHLSSNTNGYWDMSSTTSVSSIRFYTGGHVTSIRGYVYANTSNEVGFLTNDGNWGLQVDSSKNVKVFGTDLTVGNTTSSNIFMTDTDESTRRIHCNSSRIGFLSTSNNWGSYCGTDGSWYSDQSIYGSNSIRFSGAVSDDNTFGIYFGSDRSSAYGIYREGGAWSFPFPDLRIAFHTGIKFGANASYKGMNFYTDFDMSSLVMSVNNADYNTGGIYVHGSAYASAYYETSDARLKTILEDNSRVKGIELIKPKLYQKDGKTEFGYIAQDFLDIMPYAVNNDNVDRMYSLVYREIHTAKIATLEDSVEEIKAKILYLENQLKQKQ
jgi:hypothetical protein